MTTEFVLETVSSAFGISDEVPWYRAHCEIFPTLAGAREQCDADQAEMNERCGHSAWDSHRRIVPTADTTAIFHHICGGTIDSGFCPNMAEETVTLPWPAGEPRPRAETPEGWENARQCAACAEKEQCENERLHALHNKKGE